MDKTEAIVRNLDRDAVRAVAYNLAVERSHPRALLLISERYLPLLYEAVRKFSSYRLGAGAASDKQELLALLREELSELQRIDLDAINELDEVFYREYREATE